MYVGKNTLRAGRSASPFLQSRLRLWRKEEASAKRRLLLYGVGMIAPAFAGAERNGIGDFLERIAGLAFHHATDDRLGDTAGCAEDDTGTGAETKWHIGRLIGQFIEADARFLDHADELLRGEHQIDVRLTVVREFAAAGLHLLCRAGHDGNVIELLIALFLLRAQKRCDCEGLFRWHWLLIDSLEIFCDIMHQPYLGPKKALKWMEKAHPEAFDRYKRALQNFQMDDLDEWIGYIRHAAKTD